MKTVPLKYLARITLGKMLQASGPREGQEVRPYLKSLSVTETGLDTSNLPEMPFSASEQKNLDLRRGDVVVVEGGSIGRSAYLDQDLRGIHFQNSINRVRPNREVDGRFINYCIIDKRSSGYFEAITNQATIRHLTAEKLARTPIPLCGSNEQRLIADYLDRETAEIDALRLETESLIHLAQERGNALSEKLVWGCGAPVVRLKFIADILSGYPFKSENFLDLAEDTIPLLRGINVSPQGVVWDSVVSLSSSHSHQFSDYILKPGDLVLGLDRPLISSGLRLAEVEASDAGSLLVQRVARIRSKDPSTSNKWLKSALRSSRFRAHLEPDFTGVSVPHMSPGQLSEFAVPIPPLEVQSEILAEVNAENDAVSASVVDLQLLLNLLEERRSALISAAVTGQIDVAAQGASVAEQLRDELEVHV